MNSQKTIILTVVALVIGLLAGFAIGAKRNNWREGDDWLKQQSANSKNISNNSATITATSSSTVNPYQKIKVNPFE